MDVIYYLSTLVPGIAGWIKNDQEAMLPRLEENGTPSLSIERLTQLVKGGQHWGWVRADSLLQYTMDGRTSAMLFRFSPLAAKWVDHLVDLAIPKLTDEVVTMYINPDDPVQRKLYPRFIWHSHPQTVHLDARKWVVYVPAGMAMDIVHTVFTADIQGVSPLQIGMRLKAATDGADQVIEIFDKQTAKSLPRQPIFRYMEM